MINGREVGNSKMTNRQTVAVSDDEGNFLWFSVGDAQRWSGTTLNGGDLYRVAGQWVLVDELSDLTGEPARIVDEDQALRWLTCNGLASPDELMHCASRLRLE